MNKILMMKIEGRNWITNHLTPATLAEFVIDVNKSTVDLKRICNKYNITEMR